MGTDQPEHRLAIVGGGVMGTNIAALAVGHGLPELKLDNFRTVQAMTGLVLRLRDAPAAEADG
jgi:methoxymalonate biosynthesis protein